jgi:hypothetical protein
MSAQAQLSYPYGNMYQPAPIMAPQLLPSIPLSQPIAAYNDPLAIPFKKAKFSVLSQDELSMLGVWDTVKDFKSLQTGSAPVAPARTMTVKPTHAECA